MKCTKLFLSVLFLLAFCFQSANAGFGYFLDSGSFTTVGGTSYQLGNSSGGAPVFDGTNFGTFTVGSSLVLDGFQTFTFENNGDNVHSGRLIWGVAGGSSGTINTTLFADLGSGDNLHEGTGAGINLLAGLGPGTYTVSLYTELDATYNGNAFPQDDDTIWQTLGGQTLFESGGESEVPFTANFTIEAAAIPEPSAFATFGFGILLLIGRRRQYV